ncbi:MAG: hypothetical protein ACI9FU_002292 [Granulosicoccus sp.]|jgi:hypothetical protein
MSESIHEILARFSPISLKEMDTAALMNRIDTKFVVREAQLAKILDGLLESHHILEIKEERAFDYHSTYYDTEERLLFNEHIRGRTVRHKVRKREYVSSNLSFLELKNKTNQGRTIKKRTKSPIPFTELIDDDRAFLETQDKDHAPLIPVMDIDFVRFTLVRNDLGERLTVDRSLKFIGKGKEAGLGGMAIIELKQGSRTRDSHTWTVLDANKVRPFSISKYCFGMILTDPTLKYNRFKPRLLNLNKLSEHGNIWNPAN